MEPGSEEGMRGERTAFYFILKAGSFKTKILWYYSNSFQTSDFTIYNLLHYFLESKFAFEEKISVCEIWIMLISKCEK